MLFRALTLAVVVLALPTDAGAAGSARVLRVKGLFDQLYFREALGACNAALEAGRSSRAELVQLLGYKALIAGSLGQEAQATEVFKRLLTIDPRAKLARGYAPRIRRAYENAARWVAKQGAIQVVLEAPETVPRDGKLTLRLKLERDPLGQIARASLHLRAAGPGSASYASHPGDPARAFNVSLVGVPGIGAATLVDYYLVVLDKDHNELVLLGSPAAPRRVRLTGAPPALPALAVTPSTPVVPPPVERRRPLVARWWFWTTIGVALAATAVGVGVGVGARGSRDTVTAPVRLETGP
jgi:hypothetical protein